MDRDELALWMAWFDEYDPEQKKQIHADLRAGVVASTIANSALGSHGGYRPEDFITSLKQAKGSRNEQEMEKAMIAWCANVGGEVKVEKTQ